VKKGEKRLEGESCDSAIFQVRVSLAIQLYYSVVLLIMINKHRVVFERIEIRLKLGKFVN